MKKNMVEKAANSILEHLVFHIFLIFFFFFLGGGGGVCPQTMQQCLPMVFNFDHFVHILRNGLHVAIPLPTCCKNYTCCSTKLV